MLTDALRREMEDLGKYKKEFCDDKRLFFIGAGLLTKEGRIEELAAVF